jgi:peptidoglycan/xylan/chitin deacetylase (PgdA/CDA1 family)
MTMMPKTSVSALASDPGGVCGTMGLELRRAARPTVLAYHELSLAPMDYSYALSCRQFAEHLQLVAQLQQASNGKAAITLSFDDGHVSNYTHALSLLEKYSCKAIFFVIVGRVGENKDSMNWDQLRELVALGHRVESHSFSHQFLTECSNSDLREELMRSKETLEGRLGNSVEALSAPHGRWNRRVLRACAEVGYRRLYTSNPWSQSRFDDPIEVIGRLIMVQAMDADRLLGWLTMGHTQISLHRARHALKKSAQRVLGNKLYYHLWTRFAGWRGGKDKGL